MIKLSGVWWSRCGQCGSGIHWQDCPTGGWWIHLDHPEDNHDATGEGPLGYMNARGEMEYYEY